MIDDWWQSLEYVVETRAWWVSSVHPCVDAVIFMHAFTQLTLSVRGWRRRHRKKSGLSSERKGDSSWWQLRICGLCRPSLLLYLLSNGEGGWLFSSVKGSQVLHCHTPVFKVFGYGHKDLDSVLCSIVYRFLSQTFFSLAVLRFDVKC